MPTDIRGASVELSDLVMHYGGQVAVDGISLAIAPGEFLTLLGPSGSGKTTTLNLIAGFLNPSSGSIVLDGTEVGRVPSHRRNIGMVFQHYALFPHMTAFENIAFPLRRRRVDSVEVRRRVAQAFSLVRLSGYERHYPRQLSGGQQQRVAVARAVVFNPRLLLMDEPLGALDRRLRESLQLEVKRLHRELGITFLYVTHDQEEALALSQRIAVFNKGRIEQVGPPAEVYEQPANVFVADFLGDSTQFAGVVDGGRERVRVACEKWSLKARNTSGLKPGEPGVVIVRPEKIRIRPAVLSDGKPEHDERNELRGRVKDLSYLGPTQRIEVELETGGDALVRRPPGEGPALKEGETVEVSWLPEEAVLLPTTQL